MTPPRWLPWMLLVAYVLAARGAGNLYPFSTFEMYGSTPLTSASRIVAIDRDEVREIERFSRWRCPLLPSADPRACASEWPYFYMEGVDRSAVDRIRAAEAPANGAERVEVVRRIWRFSGTDAPAIADCVLAVCEAAP